MHPIIEKTLGGLSKAYYFRHFFFGLILAALFIAMAMQIPSGIPLGLAVFFAVNALLYPYSRFVYESIVNFIVGNNLFILPAVMMLVAKLITMMLCFMFAIFIAPIGLAYLYCHHTKQANKN